MVFKRFGVGKGNSVVAWVGTVQVGKVLVVRALR